MKWDLKCETCEKPITLEEADVSYAYTDKAFLFCAACLEEYKAKEEEAEAYYDLDGNYED